MPILGKKGEGDNEKEDWGIEKERRAKMNREIRKGGKRKREKGKEKREKRKGKREKGKGKRKKRNRE